MQVSVETTQGLERRLTITVPAAAVDAAVRKELNGLAKTRRIDGFRPGKAPVAIIKKMFGAMAHARVADEMMQNNFIKAIIENKLSPAGAPTMDPKEIKEGQLLLTREEWLKRSGKGNSSDGGDYRGKRIESLETGVR